ncbi:uncharacterized protein PRCAT00001921001 [Priceomyces carsonii]|uniref:uncharacterized protein n=1 Tax=Priceomyces carsonii TaxID=28549 RepID=UPI002ED7AA83|nr:unnamed protein product [Priceomyces carsonii]
MKFFLGQNVLVKDLPGIVKFVGPTEFAQGTWIGIELDQHVGRNDGSVNGIRYFTCVKQDKNHGIFAKEEIVSTVDEHRKVVESEFFQTGDVAALEKLVSRLLEKLKYVSKRMEEYRERALALQEYADKYADLETRLELALIDRDYFEDANKNLQIEIEDVRFKYEDLKAEFQLTQEELELNKEIEKEVQSQIGGTQLSETEISSVLSKNKQLEIALLNMQKMLNDKELKMTTEIKTLRNELVAMEASLNEANLLSDKALTAESTIGYLREQLDSVSQLEKIIEHLNLENDSLNQKIKTLSKEVEELNELNELNRGLEETHALMEQDLRRDLEELKRIAISDRNAISDLEKKNKFLEAKLFKFLDSAKKQTIENLKSFSGEMESLRLKISKYEADDVLNRFSLKIANTHISFLKNLNRNELGNSEDIDISLRFKFLASCCNIILESLSGFPDDFFSSPDHVPFVKSTVDGLAEYLSASAVLCEVNSSNDLFLDRIGTINVNLDALEPNVVQLIEKVKQGELADISFEYWRFYPRMSLAEIIKENLELLFVKKFILKCYCNIIAHESVFILLFLQKLQTCVDSLLCTKNTPAIGNLKLMKSSIDTLYKDLRKLKDFTLKLISDISLLDNRLELDFQVDGEFARSVEETCIDIHEIFHVLTQLDKMESSDDECLLLFESINYNSKSNTSDIFLSIRKHVACGLSTLDINYSTIILNKDVQISLQSTKDKSLRVSSTSSLKHTSLNDQLGVLDENLAAKDKIILELNLNIDLLENNMLSLKTTSDLQITQLQETISKLNEEYQENKTKFAQLVESYSRLEKDMKSLIESNRLIEGGHSFEMFSDAASAQQCNQNIALLEETVALRKAISILPRLYQLDDDHSWLSDLLRGKQNYSRSKLSNCLYLLNEITASSKRIRLNDNRNAWEPTVDLPRFIKYQFEEKMQIYEKFKNDALISLNN